jgi:iron complex outermembrane receptor protein
LPNSTACPAVFPAVFGQSSRAPLKVQSESVYGLVHYTRGPVTVSGELRYSYDDKEASQKLYQLHTTIQAAAPASYEFISNRINYTVNISYKLPEDVPGGIIYAKVGTGFRAGGINARVSSPFAPNPFRPTYGDEDTTSYEVGYKGNLRPNIFFRLSGYASRTINAITSINDGCTVLNACGQPGIQFNINGGTVEARGVEAAIDGRFHIADGLLTFSLNGGRQHAKYVKTPGGFSGLPLVGSSVAQIPKWTSSATVGYRHALISNLDGFANLSYQGQTGGTQDATTAATPAIELNSLDFLNLRTGVDYKKLEFAIFVTNLTNKQIALLQFQSAGVTFANRNSTPRTVGANLIYRW